MWRVKPIGRESWFKSRKGKVTFGVSCVVVREDGKHSKIMVITNGCCQIHVKGFYECEMGGINGASGVCLFTPEMNSVAGKGLKYIITNSTAREVK